MESLPSDLSTAEKEKAQLLHTAIRNGDLTIVTETLSQWPTQPSSSSSNLANVPDSAGVTHYNRELWPFTLALHTAIHHDQPDVVAYVFGRGHKANDTSLKAVEAESVRIFQALFDNGWDLNAPVMQGLCPPLCYLVKNEPVVRWFLSHGANPDASAAPNKPRTPVTSACATSPLHIVKLFYVYGASHRDVLQTAAESKAEGRLEVMKFLLDGGADVNAVKWSHDEESFMTWMLFGLGTALHYAAKIGDVDKVKLLLERGARLDILDSMGQTPCEVARKYGKSEVAEILESL